VRSFKRRFTDEFEELYHLQRLDAIIGLIEEMHWMLILQGYMGISALSSIITAPSGFSLL
jgi:hypothetical protein